MGCCLKIERMIKYSLNTRQAPKLQKPIHFRELKIMDIRAFSPALQTPRITTSIYHGLRSQNISLLSTFYKYVTSPSEVPEKLSHGDIDIVICAPLDSLFPPTSTSLSVALSAEHIICNRAINSFAIPYPGKFEHYVQVDAQLATSVDFWE